MDYRRGGKRASERGKEREREIEKIRYIRSSRKAHKRENRGSRDDDRIKKNNGK